MATTGQKITIGTLTLLVLSYAIYVTLNQEVRLRVDHDKATFYIFNENNRWEVSGREYNRLFDGSTLQYRDRSSIYVTYENIDNYTIIIRFTHYQNGADIIDRWYFLNNVSDIELFPITHKVVVVNGKGLFYRYSLDELEDTGEKRKLTETELDFGDNMHLSLNPGYRWAWVGWPYGSDSLAAQYDIKSNYEVFEFRFFDPQIKRTVKYTRSTIEVCEGKTCTLHLSSSPLRDYNENGDLVELEYSKLVNGTWVEYFKVDKDAFMDIVEVRETSVKACMNISDKYIGKNVTYKWGDNIEEIYFSESKTQYCGFFTRPENDRFKFGENSTTIQLQDADTENLGDTYIDQSTVDDNKGDVSNYRLLNRSNSNKQGLLKYDITQLPAGATIDDGTFCNYVINGLDNSGEGYNVSAHHHFNLTWDEGNGAADGTEVSWGNFAGMGNWNASVEDTIYFFGGAGEPTAWQCYNVTNMTKNAYSVGDDNLTIFLLPSDVFGSPNPADYLQIDSKESATASQRPYLNITYTAAPDETPPDLFFVSPTSANNSYTNNVSWIYVNVSGNEAIDVCLLDNSSAVNTSMTVNGDYCYYNITGLANLTNQYFTVYGNDTAGNLNRTAFRNITVNLTDAPPPVGDTCDTCDIDCTEDCTVDTELDCENGALTFTGDGIVTLDEKILNWATATIIGGCKVACQGGNCLW